MKRLAMIATAATMLMGAAQPPRQTPPRPAPPAAVPQPRQPAPAAPRIPMRVSARTLTGVCGQDRSACLTYVLGSVDSFAGALVAAGRPQIYCFPAGTTNDQIAQAAVRYLRAHPQEAGNNAALVVVAGVTAAYPCGY